jgi:hypothetical protein
VRIPSNQVEDHNFQDLHS